MPRIIAITHPLRISAPLICLLVYQGLHHIYASRLGLFRKLGFGNASPSSRALVFGLSARGSVSDTNNHLSQPIVRSPHPLQLHRPLLALEQIPLHAGLGFDPCNSAVLLQPFFEQVFLYWLNWSDR
jgi:hypothetical protein